ncbi:hypothetical protein FXW78_19430 [Rhodococcus opacus]|nr:hypothetical protein [Rhodococcus opacus]
MGAETATTTPGGAALHEVPGGVAIDARIARHARRAYLWLSAHAPWIDLVITALARLNAIPDP